MQPKSTTRQPSSQGNQPTGISVESMAESWYRAQQARNLSPRTLEARRLTIRTFLDFARAQPADDPEQAIPIEDIGLITRDHMERYITAQQYGHKSNTVAVRFAMLKTFWRWVVEEEEIDVSPMRRMKAPLVEETPPDLISEDELRAILATCSGKTFTQRRDRAILLLLIDTGMRRSEFMHICLGDIDHGAKTISIMGKGRRARTPHYSVVAAAALDSYLRARQRFIREHPAMAEEPRLWLGRLGPLSSSTLAWIVKYRAGQANVDGVHPHLLRHIAAHLFLKDGGGDDNLRRLFGWGATSKMPWRYGAALANERAHDAHAKHSPADNLMTHKSEKK